jgi:hypothetical protein
MGGILPLQQAHGQDGDRKDKQQKKLKQIPSG